MDVAVADDGLAAVAGPAHGRSVEVGAPGHEAVDFNRIERGRVAFEVVTKARAQRIVRVRGDYQALFVLPESLEFLKRRHSLGTGREIDQENVPAFVVTSLPSDTVNVTLTVDASSVAPAFT